MVAAKRSIKALPPIPRDATPEMRQLLTALAENARILGNQGKGSQLDAAVTFRDIGGVSAGRTLTALIDEYSAIGGLNNDIAPDTPTAPTGVVISASDTAVIIGWDAPSFTGYWYTQVYRTTWDGSNLVGFDEAFAVAQTAGVFMDLTVSQNADYIYWLRHVNTAGTKSPLSSSAGHTVRTLESLDYKKGWITQDRLEADLQERIELIDLIDLPAVGMLARIGLIESDYVDGDSLASELSKFVPAEALALELGSYVTTEALEAEDFAKSSQLTAFVTDTALDGRLSSYVTSTQLANADYATSTELTAYVLGSELGTTLESYVTTTALATADYVTSGQLTAYVKDIDLNTTLNSYVTSSALASEGFAKASSLTAYVLGSELDTALESYVTTTALTNANYATSSQLTAYVKNVDLNTALSSYVTATALANEDYAKNSSLTAYVKNTDLNTTLSSYVSNTALAAMGYATTSQLTSYATVASVSAVEQRMTANENEAYYSLKVEANGKVAGFGVTSNPSGTAILFSADQFGVTNGSDTVMPFSIRNGLVYINDARIVQLQANKIFNVGNVDSPDAGLAHLGNTFIEGAFTMGKTGQIKKEYLDPNFRDLLVMIDPNATITGGTRAASTTAVNGTTYICRLTGSGATGDAPIPSGGATTTLSIRILGGVKYPRDAKTTTYAPVCRITVYRKKTGGSNEVVDNALYTGTATNVSAGGGEIIQHRSNLDVIKNIVLSAPTSGANYEYWYTVSSVDGSWAADENGNIVAGGSITVTVSETIGSSGGVLVESLAYSGQQYFTVNDGGVGRGASVTAGGLYVASFGKMIANSSGQVFDNGNRVYSAGNTNIGTGSTNYAAGNHSHSNYAQTNGTGASGTWGINISGTASNASSLGGVAAASFTQVNGNLPVNAWISAPGHDANATRTPSLGFTYSNNAPHVGPLATFGSGDYVMQLNSRYGDGNAISWRGMNGDNQTWGSWHTLYHTGYKPTPADIGAVPTARETSWLGSDAASSVVGMMAWRHYGNGHVIFDASAALSPSGVSVDRSNAQVAWTATYPTLMGWNGTNTFGVRVDSARVADSAGTASNSSLLEGLSSAQFLRRYNRDDDQPANFDTIPSGTWLFSQEDGGNPGGTLPAGAHNGTSVLSTQTHNGNYFSQLALDTNQNKLWLRSCNNTSAFGAWAQMWSSSNQGAGSGMNADLLDGLQGAAYGVLGNAQTWTGVNTFNSGNTPVNFKGDSAGGYCEIYISSDGDNRLTVGSIGSAYSDPQWANSCYVYSSPNRNLWFKSLQELSLFTGGHGLEYKTLICGTSGTVDAPRGRVASPNGFTVNQTNGAGYGVSLYSDNSFYPEYGLMFATTGNYGGHGYVTGDWATYFTMAGASNRGWIFKSRQSGNTAGNVASITAGGDARFNGIASAREFRGNGNVGGTAEAIYCPAGVFSQGTNWLYGPIITSNNYIDAGTGAISAGQIVASNRVVSTGSGNDYSLAAFEARGSGSNNAAKPAVGFHQPGLYAGSLQMLDGGNFAFYRQGGLELADVKANAAVLNRGAAGYDAGQVGSFSCSNWFRSSGGTGWFNASYGGGIYMVDATWIRTYGGKQFYVDNTSSDAIYTAGGVRALGTVTGSDCIATSDRRVKDNLIPIKHAMAKVETLTGYTFDRKDMEGRRHAGLIAQDVREVLPEAIFGTSEHLQLSSTAVVGLLVEAIKELSARVRQLEAA